VKYLVQIIAADSSDRSSPIGGDSETLSEIFGNTLTDPDSNVDEDDIVLVLSESPDDAMTYISVKPLVTVSTFIELMNRETSLKGDK
jgi:hypothetical protein